MWRRGDGGVGASKVGGGGLLLRGLRRCTVGVKEVDSHPTLLLCFIVADGRAPGSSGFLVLSALSCLILPISVVSTGHLPLVK